MRNLDSSIGPIAFRNVEDPTKAKVYVILQRVQELGNDHLPERIRLFWDALKPTIEDLILLPEARDAEQLSGCALADFLKYSWSNEIKRPCIAGWDSSNFWKRQSQIKDNQTKIQYIVSSAAKGADSLCYNRNIQILRKTKIVKLYCAAMEQMGKPLCKSAEELEKDLIEGETEAVRWKSADILMEAINAFASNCLKQNADQSFVERQTSLIESIGESLNKSHPRIYVFCEGDERGNPELGHASEVQRLVDYMKESCSFVVINLAHEIAE